MKKVMQFKIILNYSQPKIWRRIQVPETYTFWDLHCAIQNAMGWTDSHLHAFYITTKKRVRVQPIVIQLPEPEFEYGETYDEQKKLISQWFPLQLKQCIYTYDMGDSWDHSIEFEKALPATAQHYPICLAGKNACPPEDCGGVGGYIHLLSAIKNPKTEDDEELREWMGLEKDETYDPTQFSTANVVFENSEDVFNNSMQYR